MRRSIARYLFPLLALLALALRLIALDSRPLEYDDAFSIALAAQPLGRIVAGTAADTMPPLYYFLLHFWMLIGRSAWSLRLLNVSLSLATVVLFYVWARGLFGQQAAAWGALLLAVSPFDIFHAQGMRMYVLLGLAVLGYWFCFSRILHLENGGSHWRWVGLVLCGAAALYTHNLAVFCLAGPDVYLLLKRRFKLLGCLLLAQAGSLLLALPWLAYLPGQVSKIQTAFWTPRPGLVEVVQLLVTLHTNLPVPAAFLALAVLVSLVFFSLVAYDLVRNHRLHPDVQLLAVLALTPALLLFIASYLMRPVFVPRALLPASLAYYALAGYALSQARLPAIRLSLGLLFVLPALGFLPAQYAFAEFPRSPSKSAAAYLATQLQPGDLVLHDNKLSFFPMNFYAPELPQVFLPDPKGSPNDTLAPATQAAMDAYPLVDLGAALQGRERVWFVVFERALEEYRQAGKDHPVLVQLAAGFTLASERSFNDLRVYEFTRWRLDSYINPGDLPLSRTVLRLSWASINMLVRIARSEQLCEGLDAKSGDFALQYQRYVCEPPWVRTV